MKENNFMKKKKGFTLIELLAVIVLLAILALIVIPIVLRLINKSREDSAKRSVDNYLDGVKKTIMSDETLSQMKIMACRIDDNTSDSDQGSEITGSINCCEDADCDSGAAISGWKKVDVDGQKPNGGWIYFDPDDGTITNVESVKFGKFYVSGNKSKYTVVSKKSTGSKPIVTKTFKYNGEEYYLISNEGEYYTGIKKWPLSTEEVLEYGRGYINVYGQNQDNPATRGTYGAVAWYSDANCFKGDVCRREQGCREGDPNDCWDEWTDCHEQEKYSSCPSSYAQSHVKNIVENWANSTLNMDDLVTDKYGYKVRLINDNDIINKLGGSTDSTGSVGGTVAINYTSRTPRWLKVAGYNTWTMSVDEDIRANVHVLGNYGVTDLSMWEQGSESAGVIRPVINVKESAVTVSE